MILRRIGEGIKRQDPTLRHPWQAGRAEGPGGRPGIHLSRRLGQNLWTPDQVRGDNFCFRESQT